MYTIAVCDTNKHEADMLLNSLQSILEELNFPYKCYYYDNASSLYETLEKYPEKYNCLFLETELTPFNGIALARKLRSKGYEGIIVLVSKKISRVYDAFDVEAFQYLRKPVDEGNLRRLIFRISMKIQQRKKQYLYLNYGVTWHKILYADILYIETSGRKVAIYSSHNEEPVYYPCHLSDMEEILPSWLFIRCHQSYIVQFHAISHMTASYVTLTDGTELPISRSYKQNIRDAFLRADSAKMILLHDENEKNNERRFS